MTDKLEPIQADRDAAADYLGATGVDWCACGDVRSGRTSHPAVDAFARHRIDHATQPQGERNKVFTRDDRPIAETLWPQDLDPSPQAAAERVKTFLDWKGEGLGSVGPSLKYADLRILADAITDELQDEGLADELEALIDASQKAAIFDGVPEDHEAIMAHAETYRMRRLEIANFVGANWPRILSALRSQPDMAEVREALDTRDLFSNPDLLDQAAEEIDCDGMCENIWREGDTNASGCYAAEKGEYCPNDVAETLREVAKVARSALDKLEGKAK